MKPNMSLGQFRSEMGSYSSFRLTFDDPLSSVCFSAMFDTAAVNLSAAPYIAFKNSHGDLCLKHIQSIKKRGKTAGHQSYIFICNDYSLSDDPAEVRYVLDCI